MQKKTLGATGCPIARSLERVGEWWSILILRDAFAGISRFDEFQTSLGIAPNMLTRRLKALVAAGLLEKRRYIERPARYEYVLTDRGEDFRSVLIALFAFGNRHFAPDGETFSLVDAQTGARAEPVLTNAATGELLTAANYRIVLGPAATAGARRRVARHENRAAKSPSQKPRPETRQ